ncbi:MAG TPA: signal peptide peptidase SppA [Sphingomonadaceae bacterium]|nr:signal peptide peptidase SppA [Sphingomonadaceae bacterium]
MRFVRGVWRVLVGVKDALVLILMLLFFGVLYAALSAGANPAAIRDGALLVDLKGSIVEQPAEVDPFAALAGGGAVTREYRLRDIVAGLEAAATDKRVKAVALDLDQFLGGGQASLADVAAAIDTVRRANKPVVAYATGYSDDGYQLASHASEIWLNPLGTVAITGPGGNGLYFAGLLEKLGVTANVYRVGTYKAAVEPLIRNDASPEAKAAAQALANSLWEIWQNNVRQARPKAQVAAYAANPAALATAAGGDLAQAALRAGMVDRLGDRTAFGRRMAELAGNDKEKVPGAFNTIKLADWTKVTLARQRTDGRVGVVTVAGTIVDGRASAGTAGGDTIAAIIDKALEERELKALVLRIDSGGGSVLASERIRQAVLNAKSKGMPVVASMGAVAASGGYWVAMPADHVMAEPSTITGSIGVFGVIPSFQGSLQKAGIGADGVKTTPLSGEPDLFRGPSPAFNQLIQLSIESTYKRFLGLVSQARKLPVARVDEIAQGRVWDGGTARQIGLIDSYGGLSEAIAKAASLAKLGDDYAPVFLEQPLGFRALLMQAFGGGDDGSEQEAAHGAFGVATGRPELALTRALADASAILTGPAIQARCLECPPSAAVNVREAKRGATLLSWLTR